MAARKTHTPAQREVLVRRAMQRRGEGCSGKTIAAALGISQRACYRLRQHPDWHDPAEVLLPEREARGPASVRQASRDAVCSFANDLPRQERAWVLNRRERTVYTLLRAYETRAPARDTPESCSEVTLRSGAGVPQV